MTIANWSRRRFLSAIAATGAAVTLNPLAAWKTRADDALATAGNIGDPDPRVASIVAETIGIDTHNHIDVPLTTDTPGPTLDLAAELKRSGLSAICMTFAVDYQKLVNPGDAYTRFRNGLWAMDQQLKLNHTRRALNLADLRAAHKKHEPIVIQSVEGGHFLEGKIDRLAEAYSLGLRHLGLLHDNDASVPLGDVYTNAPKYGGLTAFGSDVIKECNHLGILIDLAHANLETTTAALKITKHPVIVSHTGLDTQLGSNPEMARMMRPRLISKEQAKLVADNGGVVGVWTHLADTPLEYAQNIRALVDVIGVDHVAIGTDTKLALPPRPDGSPQGPGRFGQRTNQAWPDQKDGFYYAVVDAMLKTGFTKEEIGKIGGGNFCRVFDVATSALHPSPR